MSSDNSGEGPEVRYRFLARMGLDSAAFSGYSVLWTS